MIELSVIIPAYNEELWIGQTIDAAIDASVYASRNGRPGPVVAREAIEILVVDNGSRDATRAVVECYGDYVRLLDCERKGAPCARNDGARASAGRVLVFVDADTAMPPEALARALEHCDEAGCEAGIIRLAESDGGRRARLWWLFWEHVRRLPLPRAKAMPAFMFCTKKVFDELGPFDERVAIGEEWPILASVYRRDRRKLIYDRSMTALSSSRRMELQPFGYLRTFFKYVWAILVFQGRVNYSDRIR